MNLRPSLLIMSLLGLAILSPAAAWAQKPATAPATVIKVSDMHCAACAQKISRKLYAVPGVVQVKTNLKQHAAVITPEKNRQPNPLAVWEAVEAAGFAPTELTGPAGKFTKKEDLEKAFQRTARRQ